MEIEMSQLFGLKMIVSELCFIHHYTLTIDLFACDISLKISSCDCILSLLP